MRCEDVPVNVLGAIGELRGFIWIDRIMLFQTTRLLIYLDKACKVSLSVGDRIIILGSRSQPRFSEPIVLCPPNSSKWIQKLFAHRDPICCPSKPGTDFATDLGASWDAKRRRGVPRVHQCMVGYGFVWLAQWSLWRAERLCKETFVLEEVCGWRLARSDWRLFGSASKQFGGHSVVPECGWHESVAVVEFASKPFYWPLLLLPRMEDWGFSVWPALFWDYPRD